MNSNFKSFKQTVFLSE